MQQSVALVLLDAFIAGTSVLNSAAWQLTCCEDLAMDNSRHL